MLRLCQQTQNFIRNRRDERQQKQTNSKSDKPIRRIISKAKESNMLIDATYGRRSRSVLVTDSDHVILSPIQPETIANRLSSEYEAAEEEESDE